MADPAYAFSIPSVHDDTVLDCRIYHQEVIADVLKAEKAPLKGAIVAHPYAPLGGCYDDPVVLSVTECLLGQGHVVITFNFRGAGESKGRTSWTGKPEVDDYSSVVGLLVYYLNNLKAPKESDVLTPIVSTSQPNFDPSSPFDEHSTTGQQFEVLLAGYSFGSLILSRLPSVSTILQRFETAERGTAASEIFLRANMLAKQTRQSHQEVQSPQSSRGRTLHPQDSPTKPRSSPIIVGGEETDVSDRRRSRDSRRSSDIIREVPHNIKTHIQRRHSGRFSRKSEDAKTFGHYSPNVSVRYLMISPVLLPMTTTLLSPGIPFTSGSTTEPESGLLSLSRPSLIIFGSLDSFTASKKLRQWSEKLAKDSAGQVNWSQIDHAGHFWREKGVMKALRKTIVSWIK